MNSPTLSDSLQRQAFSQIRQMILSGELAPGEPVMERALGRQLEMSRGSLRDPQGPGTHKE